jgi:hypothetical protein
VEPTPTTDRARAACLELRPCGIRVAPLVLFLVSDEASCTSGAEISVGGGMTAPGGVTSISDAVRAATP